MKLIKVVKDKIMGAIEQKKENDVQQEKLRRWKNKLDVAMSTHNAYRNNCMSWDNIYNGTKLVGKNNVYISDRDGDSKQNDARQVINIVHQLIESQIQINVPKPSIEIIEGQEDLERKNMIEGMLTYMSEGPELERMTADNERIVKKNSLAIFKVMYNPDYVSHSFRGRIETTNPHPTNVIPQPNVKKIEDMDYLFHIENRTIDYVCRRYGEEFRTDLEEENAEYEYLENFTDGPDNANFSNNKVSVVECWYKDKDGDVCLITWANETLLRDEPKFFYKRDEKGNIVETEIVEMDDIDPTTQQPVKKEIEVKCHVPKRFPFVIWYNIPKEKSYYGKSDVEIILDQQEAVKKVMSSQEEKLIKGTSKIFVRKGSGLENKITNSMLQVIPCDEPMSDVVVKDLKTPDNDYMNYYQVITQAAKDTLGVTQAYQGQLENKSLSGRAIQQLSANSEGRLSVKAFEKQVSFRELYRLYYDFILAFYDDTIPYRVQDTTATPNDYKYGYFDKGKLIKQDAAGEYYYPEFDIYVNSDIGLPKDKNFIIQSMQAAVQSQLIDSVEYWTIMESIDFPCASAILDMERKKQQQQLEQQQQATSLQQQNGQSQVNPQEQQQTQEEASQQENINQLVQKIIDSMNSSEKTIFENADDKKKLQIIQQLIEQSKGGENA